MSNKIIIIKQDETGVIPLGKSPTLWDNFKKWVENTKLFNAIIIHSGNPDCRIDGFSEKLSLSLNLNSRKISTFEELPPELLMEFYINSPWYHPTNWSAITEKIKENGNNTRNGIKE